MTFLCIKYSGLKFYYTFETTDFVFIPMNEAESEMTDTLDIEKLLSCKYDASSNFYVLLKEPSEFTFTIEEFSEENLYKFKLLEAILNLLFSNYLKRNCIFVLERIDSEFTVKKIFNNLSKDITENNAPLLWKNKIIIKFLQDLINSGFDKFRTFANKKDFALRYSFCVDMYLRGKFGENRLRYISDLWISLEVLSVITISHILHSHESFKVGDNFKELKDIVEEISLQIFGEDGENIDCWPKMKEKFPEHMKNKINNFLPIFQKCVKVVEEYIDINDIKVRLREEEDASAFKEYQDSITIKKILSYFYKYRNKLFHGGKIHDKWSLKFDRYKANFIKLIEQLFFRILGLNMICFYQMGYPYQRIFGILKEEGNLMDLGNLSHKTRLYIHKHYIEPVITDYRRQFEDFEIVKENYIDKTHECDPLKSQLNSFLDQVLVFLRDNHPVELVIDGEIFNHSMSYQDIKNRTIVLTFESSTGLYGTIFNKKLVKIKNLDIDNISSLFVGMFNDDDVRDGPGFFLVPFLINPPYISFEFS